MDFRVLGPLEVASDAETASRISGRKERAVLAALLVHHGQPRSAEELVAAVWGDDAPPTAEKSLQVRLSHLRSALADGKRVLVRDGTGYRLDVPADAIDAHRFARTIDAAASLPAAEALVRYEQALGLVRGRPYADVEEFDGLASEIRRLDALRLRAVDGRLRALLDLGRHAEALPELERVVRDEPHHEGLAALLMLALYRAGRQVEALEVYRATADRLLDLGLEPSEDLRRLEGDILSHQVAAVAQPAGTAAGANAPPARRTNLPARVTSFVGRRAEVVDVQDQLRLQRLVTATGPGGVGKSSIAIEAARELVDELTDGAWLVDLAALESPDQIPSAMLDALPFGATGANLQDEGREAIDTLCERLAGRETLLVLNDCEHLAAGVARVVERVLAEADGVRVLATSRQALGALGEAILDIRPFDPEGTEAPRLFVERAQAVQPAFRLDDATRDAVSAICARLDGLPLALELAAARVRALGVDEVASRLDDRFGLLGEATDDGSQGARGRRTLGEVVAWSFGLLPAAEQELFCRLCVFRAPFTIEAAERVAGGGAVDRDRIPELLVSLVDRSMVAAEDGGYRMLETLREFGLRRLEERGALESTFHRHASWAAAVADTHGRRLYAEGVDAVRRALAPHRPDLDAAIDLALDEGDADLGLPLASALGVLDFGLGDSTRARTRLARVLRLPVGQPQARVPALTLQAGLLTLHGLVEQGATAATDALDAATDDRWRDRARAYRATARLLGGDVAGALEDFEGLEDRFTVRGELWIRGMTSGWQAFVRLVLGELVEAERLSRRAVQAFERCNDVWGLMIASVNLARVGVALGAYDDAAGALERAREVGEATVPQRLGPILHDLGLVELRRERFEHAAWLWRRCTELTAPANAGGWVLLTGPAERWYAVMSAGHLARMDGDARVAATRYREARMVLEAVEREERDTIGVNAAIATALLFEGGVTDPQDAAELLKLALARAIDSGDRRLVARVLDALAAQIEDARTGAELQGAADAVRAAAGGPLPPIERRAVEGVALALRTELGDDAYEEAVARGRDDPLAIAQAMGAVSTP